MKSLYESISTISTELNNISIEGVPSKIKDLKYTGDNANFAISIFQENLINPSVHIKSFLFKYIKKKSNFFIFFCKYILNYSFAF